MTPFKLLLKKEFLLIIEILAEVRGRVGSTMKKQILWEFQLFFLYFHKKFGFLVDDMQLILQEEYEKDRKQRYEYTQ